ncbi:MAG: hypothetical protein ACR2PG_10300, partial [Hyphomicrobiaceae bacterium]
TSHYAFSDGAAQRASLQRRVTVHRVYLNLGRAHWVQQKCSEADDRVTSNELRQFRSRAASGEADKQLDSAEIEALHANVMALTVEDMAPETHLVRLLAETFIQRQGGQSSMATVWRSIGVNPDHGRKWLSSEAQALDWPVWYTLREAALRR